MNICLLFLDVCPLRKKELKIEKKNLLELENEENARMFSWHKGSKVSLAAINKRNKASNMEKVVEKVSKHLVENFYFS